MAIVACQASTSSPAVSLASDRATSWMSSTESCFRAAWNSLRSMPHILDTSEGRVGGFSGSGRAIPRERGVSRCRASAWSDLAAHQTVEDVGLTDEHLLETEHAEDADQHRGAADDHVDAPGFQPRVVPTLLRVLGGEGAEDVLRGGARQHEVVDLLGVVLGQPELHRGDGGD